MTMHSILINALEKNHINLDAEKQTTLIHYLELMLKWNQRFNLTAITQPKEMVYLHLIDSLIVFPFIRGTQCLDIGSGAGLPGIPLAIAYPHHEWTLLDKNSKKTQFMTQVVAELGLKHVKVVQQRSEEFHPAQGFDSILCRAYGTLRLFVESTAHLLNNHGLLIALKGKYPKEELKDLPQGFKIQKVESLCIKGIDVERHIICLEED